MYAQTTWTKTTAPTLCSSNLNHLETQYDSAILVGGITMFGSSIAPTDFWLCDGAAVSIAAYPTLFAITSYKFGNPGGGNFSLPDLRGKFVVGYSTNLGDYNTLGASVGASNATLTATHVPSHNHDLKWWVGSGGAYLGAAQSWGSPYQGQTNLSTGGYTHPNVPQYVVLSYIIRYR